MNFTKKICSLFLTLIAMLNSVNATNYTVSTKVDLQTKYTTALPGDTVIVSNGTYDWGQLVLSNSNGTTTSNWIVIKSQTLNGVVFTGSTYMQFGGKRIMITGFKFANGNAGFNDVIQFRSSTSVSNYAQYCRLNNITIVNYSSDSTGAFAGLSTASDNKWVSLYGIRNRIDHCTFIDKYNGGATVVVWYDNSNYPQQSTSTYHLIDSNYFNKRSFTAGNGGESIRVGVGLTSSTYGYNTIEYNLFENLTQAEPEVVSNKSGFNTYRYNTFKNSSGGLTLRRGRYCSVYGNFFIVNKSTLTDDYGIRIIDKGHRVFNNYIEGINGNKNSLTAMRCPIILYNGTNSVNDTTNPSLVSGYMPGDSCIIAFNTIVNCQGGAGISLGYTDNGGNTFQPLGITIANNLIKLTSGQAAYNPSTNTSLTYTSSGNIFNAPSGVGLSSSTGFTSKTLNFGSSVNGILTPPSLVQDAAINTSSYSSMLNGLDVNGLTRSSIYDVGCDEINSTGSVIATPLDSTQVGAGMPLIATIKSFNPYIAYNGTTVIIKGTNFVNVSNVNFGGINATSFTVQNDSTIAALVSSGTSGNVNITANGFVSTITGFTFCSPISSTTNVSICPSALPYSWNGSRTVAGTYTFTTINSQGCDSTATLNLSVKTNTTSTTNVSICPSQLPYSWNGSRPAAGTYTFTTTNSQGCDSVATLNLTVKTNTTSTTNVSICPSALPYSWNGSRTLAGTYTFTTTNSQGCDSVATLNLTVKTNTTSTTNVSVCPSQLPYNWNGSKTVAGTYTFTTTNSQGCDSVATLNLTVKINTTSTTNVSICSSQLPYSWNGSRTAAGTYTFTTTNSQGCDSTATLNLSIGSPVTPSISISDPSLVCSGNAVTYTATPTNGGSNPIYQWKKNGSNAGSASSILFPAGVLHYGDVISCVLTANNACQTVNTANSNNITVVVVQSPSITPIYNTKTGALTSTSLMCTYGDTLKLVDYTLNGVWSSNNSNVASVTTAANTYGRVGLVVANTEGVATISYSLTSVDGCVTSATSVVTVAPIAAPEAITGSSSVCVGSTITLSTTSTGGVWSSVAGRATVNAGGNVIGTSAGTASIRYTLGNAAGCSSYVSKTVTVNAIPGIPSIAYGVATVNPQAGAGGGNNFCTNRTFTVVGSPTGGVWSKTGVLSVTTPGGVVTTGAVAGSGSLTYTVTSNGCSISRSISGNVVTCAARGAISNEQLVSKNDFIIYPNPAKGFVSVNVNKITPNAYLVLNDFTGRIICKTLLTESITNLSTSNLETGMYTVQLIENNEISKIIPFIIASN